MKTVGAERVIVGEKLVFTDEAEDCCMRTVRTGHRVDSGDKFWVGGFVAECGVGGEWEREWDGGVEAHSCRCGKEVRETEVYGGIEMSDWEDRILKGEGV